jgi:membrane protease YdiL (CAAX protease family)
MAKRVHDDDDDDDEKKRVRYAPGNFSSFTDTGVAPPKMDEEDEAIKFDNPVEFIPYFLYAWVLLGFVFPSVVSSLPIAQEQDDGGAALLYQTQLCSEVMKLTYLSYELRKRKFSLGIDNRPQHILSGVMFGIGTSVAARVAEQILSPSLVESTSSATLAASTPMILAAVLSSTVLAPITEELFFRGVVLDYFRNTGQTNASLLSAASANVFAAAIFSLAHFNFSIPALLNLFVCGIGFGSAFLSSKRRNIAVPIIAHSVYNAGVLIETYLDGALLVQ